MQDRIALIEAARAMAAQGLAAGTSGNLSLRTGEGMLITPSAIPYDALTPEMLPLLRFDGAYGAYEGAYRPSSEWRFHLDTGRGRRSARSCTTTRPIPRRWRWRGARSRPATT